MAPSDAGALCSSRCAAPAFFASMGWRWNAGRVLRSNWRAFFEEVVPVNDARFLPPLEPVLALQLMTVVDRVSGVRSGGFLQQISSIGARRTLRDAALQWTLAVAAAGRVVGCAGRAEFASPAHILGAAAVVAATDGRLGARLVLHGGRPMRPPATAGRLQPQTRGWDTCSLI